MIKDYSIVAQNWYIETIADCFKLSVFDKYDSYIYAKEFLNSDYGYSVLMEEITKGYMSTAYMYDYTKSEFKLKKGKVYDGYVMWMYGYLIKYWISYKDADPRDVWKILPIDSFEGLFDFYHTQGWEYIINDAIARYNGVK